MSKQEKLNEMKKELKNLIILQLKYQIDSIEYLTIDASIYALCSEIVAIKQGSKL